MSLVQQAKERLVAHKPQTLALDYPEAGVLLPLTNEPEPTIILTRRSDRLRTHRGQVALPGGRRDETDASLVETALRESEEEIALPPNQVEVIGTLDQVVSRFGILVTPYVGIIPPELEFQPNPDELDAVFRVPVSFFLKDERKRTDVLSFRGMTLHVPCWQFEQYEIWGLSAIILTNFINVAFDAGIQMLHFKDGHRVKGGKL